MCEISNIPKDSKRLQLFPDIGRAKYVKLQVQTYLDVVLEPKDWTTSVNCLPRWALHHQLWCCAIALRPDKNIKQSYSFGDAMRMTTKKHKKKKETKPWPCSLCSSAPHMPCAARSLGPPQSAQHQHPRTKRKPDVPRTGAIFTPYSLNC